jgi:epoxyqueuosine reductase QueG
MVNRKTIVDLAVRFINDAYENYISQEIALHPDCVGMKIFDAPIFAFGSVVDELYVKVKSPCVIGEQFMTPIEWLPSAKTVISFFLPFSEQIKKANTKNLHWPANEWLHGRIEGQNLLKDLTLYIEENLINAGFETLSPSFDERFKTERDSEKNMFKTSWSERHVAFVCGHGTFGLSKGLITTMGICGRFGSILTNLDIPKDIRSYNDVYEYCTMCGECVTHCPAQAISLEDGKNSMLCSDFLDKTREKHNPRYGCGKCQVGVPCESGVPIR